MTPPANSPMLLEMRELLNLMGAPSLQETMEYESVWAVKRAGFYISPLAKHRFDGSKMLYNSRWAGAKMQTTIRGDSCKDLWRAAECLTSKTGEGLHYYIEGFLVVEDEEGRPALKLITRI